MRLKITHKDIDGVEHKRCSKCKQYKTLNYFGKNKVYWDGLQNRCNNCVQKYNQKYYSKTKINLKKRSRQYYNNHKEKYAKINKIYYENNKNKKAYKQRICKQVTEWHRRELKKNPAFKMKCYLRNRLNKALKRCKKDATTMELLGCNVLQLQCHLGRQFDEYMTLTNHGKTGWHMDHRVPCAAFDLKNPLHQRVCFWYRNIQPMWARDNWKKNNKYKEEDKQALIKEWIFYNV